MYLCQVHATEEKFFDLTISRKVTLAMDYFGHSTAGTERHTLPIPLSHLFPMSDLESMLDEGG